MVTLPCRKLIPNRAMVEAVLGAERQAVRDYTQRAEEAEAYGDKGLVVQLRQVI